MMSLIDLVVEATGSRVSKIDVSLLYNKLIKAKAMDYKCYIKNHEVALSIILTHFNSDLIIKYSGAQYLDDKNESWGRNEGDFIIVQVKGDKFSHFRRINYEPYKPELKFNKILSIRYYTYIK